MIALTQGLHDISVAKKRNQVTAEQVISGIWSHLQSALVIAPVILFVRQQPISIIYIASYVWLVIFLLPVIASFIYSVIQPKRDRIKKIKFPPRSLTVKIRNVSWEPPSMKLPNKYIENATLNPAVEAVIEKRFSGALTNNQFVQMINSKLRAYGYNKDKTLVATSLCCDEVNRTLDNSLAKTFGHTFSMGGLAGFPFGGVTSFGAMAHHIPTGGSCLIVYGPHVGIDWNGEVGKINRRGRPGSGACCGSATAACGFVTAAGAKAPPAPVDPLDAQQGYVSSMLMPYASRLLEASEEDRPTKLPYLLYKAQKKLIDRIVATGCGEVSGDGKIAIVGGIQINTPAGKPDYFLPLSFDIMSNKGDLIWSVQ